MNVGAPSEEAQLRILAQHYETLSVEELREKADSPWTPARILAENELIRRKANISEDIVAVKRIKQTLTPWLDSGLTRTGGEEPTSYRTAPAREETDVEYVDRKAREARKAARLAYIGAGLSIFGALLQVISFLLRGCGP